MNSSNEYSEFEVLDSGNYENYESSSTNERSDECQATDSVSYKNSQESDGSICIVFANETGVELSVIYDFIKEIGKGGFGTVHKVRSKGDNNLYAVKEFKFSDDKVKEEVKREVGYLSSLEPHLNVIRYYCTLYKKEDVGMDISMCYIVMDLCTRSLYDYLEMKKEQPVVDENFNKSLKFQLLSGLDFIHGSNIIHRDIKPANIFLKETGNKTVFVIGDFGLACDQQSSSKIGEDSWRKKRGAGTPTYSAPEQLNSDNYTFLVDIYSSGLVIFEAYCLCKTVAELRDCFKELRENRLISHEGVKSREKEVKMILKMTAIESFRPTASELLQELDDSCESSAGMQLDLGRLELNEEVPATTLETLCEQLANVIRTEEDIEIVQKRLDELRAKIAKSSQ